MSLAELNRRLEEGTPFLDESLWRQWLWDCDLHEPLAPSFNKCHLLGLLVARHRAKFQSSEVRLGDALPNIVHPSAMSSELTLRQLRDAVEDLQVHWADHCKCGDGLVDALDALWCRFGSLNLGENQCLDDLASLDPETPHRMSDACLRRFTVLFCVLFRHLELEAACVHVDTPPPDDLDIQNYHRQAGLDAFNEHAMYSDLPPAARITYKQDFAGMYHSITQVVYFHYPDYARKRQVSLGDIRTGKHHLHCLSVALELRPDIPVWMEDDAWGGTWGWVLLPGGKIYLMSKDRAVFSADSLWQLMALVD